MEIRGYLLIKSVGNAITGKFTSDLFGDALMASPKRLTSLSNRLCYLHCNGFNQQITPYFNELNHVSLLRAVLAILFLDRIGYAIKI